VLSKLVPSKRLKNDTPLLKAYNYLKDKKDKFYQKPEEKKKKDDNDVTQKSSLWWPHFK